MCVVAYILLNLYICPLKKLQTNYVEEKEKMNLLKISYSIQNNMLINVACTIRAIIQFYQIGNPFDN